MENKTKTTAGDFFIYLGVLIGLYVSTVSFISLLFGLINKWLPDNVSYSNFYSSESLRMSIAALIIFFPAFIILSRMATKALAILPEKKDMWVRRWFYFLTLFLTGLAMVIDLVTLVHYFIGGEDLTVRFILKVSVVFLVVLAVFRFYLYELRRDVTLPTPRRKYIVCIAGILVLLAVVSGIIAIGSPKTQRNMRTDEQRVNSLSSIQYAVTDYYRANDNKLPEDLKTLSQGTTNYISSIKDPETKKDYEYRIVSENKYELCATFSTENTNELSKPNYSYPDFENWTHGVGRVCFERIAGEIK